MEAVRLAPGVLDKGKIMDAAAFAAALQTLRDALPIAKKKDKKMNVIVSLSSVNMYSQVFTLPVMEGEDLDKAIGLNVQMVSPVDIARVYYGWQFLGHDDVSLRSEVAAAFADKAIVDEIVQALYAIGFITVGVESRALALTRILREKAPGLDIKKSYLLLDIDNSGIDFLVVRKGSLYFEYPNQWVDLADEKGQISIPKFQAMLAASLRQVMNFYAQHWTDPIDGIVLSAAAFGDEATAAVGESVALPILPLVPELGAEMIPPEWFVAFGCALRGLDVDAKNKEINLSGEGAMDTFHEEQIMHFMGLWRVLVPSVLGLLIIFLFFADNFLVATKAAVEAQPAFTQQGAESAQLMAFEASSTAFNQDVALVAGAERQINKNYMLIADINTIAANNNITVNQISFQSVSTPISVQGTGPSPAAIAAFKAALQSDPHFGPVTLPLLNIQQGGQGQYSFSMTFSLTTAF